MGSMKKTIHSGFTIVEAVIILVVIGGLGIFGYRILSKRDKSVTSQNTQANDSSSSQTEKVTEDITWQWDGAKWQPSSNPPTCPEPMVFTVTPSDLSKADSVLYPGQVRGQYKPHGGLGFPSSTNSIEVKAILEGDITSGARYIEAGETQYLLWVENDCGIAYRFDHLLKLSPKVQALADSLPAAKPDDSRTTNFDNPLKVKAGDIVATEVGFAKTKNVSYDLGVYDLRKPNKSAQNPAYLSAHKNMESQAGYAVCWLDMFSANDVSRLKSLPARDGKMGKTSDYCT